MSDGWVSTCPPGEFEPQAALLLGLTELLPFCPQVMVDVIRAIIDRIHVIGIVHSEEQRWYALALLCDWGLPAQRVHFLSMPVRSMWVRDYGPAFVRWSDGKVTIVDAEYAQPDRRNDDAVPTALSGLLRVPMVKAPLALEGGNLISNGEGFCLTSAALATRNRHHGYDWPAIMGLLDRCYGFYHSVTFSPLEREPSGHVDLFAAFVRPDTVVLGSYDPAVDAANAAILDENARLLEGVRTRSGPLKVVRIPMPPNRDGFWRTYTNVIFANGALLVPTYPGIDPALDARALAIYRGLLPDWQVIPIDAGDIIPQGGALRCMSINIPWLEERFAEKPATAPPFRPVPPSAAA